MKLGKFYWVDGALHRFAAVVLITAATLIFPIRNATEQLNESQVNAAASESASSSSQALIDVGYRFTCIVRDGGVQCWGRQDYGELGDGTTTTDRSSAVTVLTSTSPSTALTGVSTISSGRLHACALTTSGGVKCWGYNGYGQIGDGTTTNRSVAVDVSGLTS
ncbi:MAG: RCC1 domain-containing protein, partial [Actinomycetota bacterium]